MRLYAAILREPTWEPKTGKLNGLGKAREELERLQKYVTEAWQKITEMREAHPVVDWQAVFLAPEYFFSNQREAKARFFSHDVKRYIIQGLAALSKQYPKLLIVPGTVLWTKDLHDTDKDGKKVWNDKRAQSLNTRSAQANSKFRTTTNTKDWDFVGDLSKTDVLIAQNVAYVCLGTQIVKYHKVGNYKEVEGEKGNVFFAPGSIVGRFNVGGVKYGLEICMDHALGALNTSISTQGAVHIQLIVSSYVDFKQRDNAPVTLHSSTESSDIMAITDKNEFGRVDQVKGNVTQIHMPKTKQVRFQSGGGARLAAGFRNNPAKIGPLTIWAIDLDNQKLGISDVNSYKIKDTALKAVNEKYFA
jgi:predicted amidohydrolase